MLAAFSADASATPLTGADLAATCESAFKHDFKGMDAAMCEWYVRPCEVCGVNKPPPVYCLPPDLASRELAAVVVHEIGGRSELRPYPVKQAVEEVLKSRYPCSR